MNSQGHQNSAPDSWDDTMDAGSGDKDSINDVSKGLSALNVNANPFVPGQNVFAKEFVMPSFGGTQPSETENEKEAAATPEAKEVTEKTQNSVEEMEVEKESPVETPEEEKRDAPDDWEEEGLGSSESTEDDDGGGTNGSVEDGARAVTIKTKKPKPEKISSVKKNHLNIVFIGHVDAGKSTIGGHIMYLTGRVDQRTLEKYEREAKDKNRESWYLSWALDTNQEERDKGKTVEVGRAYFDTENKHFTILDAPGHKSFVPNMIGGASQADVACLVISARKGEFETGFERGGQTREHAMLVKTAGVKRLIVVVNKMDDPTVMWDIERYNEIVEKLTPYLKKCGFNPKTDIVYIPVSGLTGAFLKEAPEGNVCPWYSGPSLIGYLDSLPAVNRMSEGPLRLPIVDRYRDMGTVVLGKLESGSLSKGQVVLLMPNKVPVEVMQLWSDDEFATSATSGENVKIKLKNVEEEDVSPGFVLCPSDNVCHTGKVFDAQIVIIEHKSIICAGYSAVLHIHTSSEEVTIKALICLVDKKTGDKSKTRPRFVKQDQIAIVRLELLHGMVCLETFKDFPQMGRFTLRDEGKTIAMGKVLKIVA